MSKECYIAGRIFLSHETKSIALSRVLEFAQVADEFEVSFEILASYCKKLSLKFQCKVCLWKIVEEYGNLNVFNGGSDYEIVNEDCFLCIYENGLEVLLERTPYWNKKIEKIIMDSR